jgi:hypothetical protein
LEQNEHALMPARAPHFGKHHFLFTVIKHYCTKALPILSQKEIRITVSGTYSHASEDKYYLLSLAVMQCIVQHVSSRVSTGIKHIDCNT